jgi:hypothetical protein
VYIYCIVCATRRDIDRIFVVQDKNLQCGCDQICDDAKRTCFQAGRKVYMYTGAGERCSVQLIHIFWVQVLCAYMHV